MAVTAARFRELALAEAGATEGAHGGHPDFRIGGKVFASLGAPSLAFAMVKLTPHEQHVFMAESTAYSQASGAWGAKGYTRVALAEVDEASLESAIRAAAQAFSAVRRR